MNFAEAMNLVAGGATVARQCWPSEERVGRTPAASAPTRYTGARVRPYQPTFADLTATDWYAVHDSRAPRYDFVTLIGLLHRLPRRYCGVRDLWTDRGYGLGVTGLGDTTRVSRSAAEPRLALRAPDYLATDWYITDLTTGRGPTEEELREARPVGKIISVPVLTDIDARLTPENVRVFVDHLDRGGAPSGPVWSALHDFAAPEEDDA